MPRFPWGQRSQRAIELGVLVTQWAVPTLTIAFLLGCTSLAATASQGGLASSNPTPARSAEAELADELGAQCKDAATGAGCIAGNLDAGDFYDIGLSPSCTSQEGHFGNVLEGKPALLSELPVTGSHARALDRLGSDRLLCIQATAHVKAHIAYYYVVDITPGDAKACVVETQGSVRGDCNRGWIEAKAMVIVNKSS